MNNCQPSHTCEHQAILQERLQGASVGCSLKPRLRGRQLDSQFQVYPNITCFNLDSCGLGLFFLMNLRIHMEAPARKTGHPNFAEARTGFFLSGSSRSWWDTQGCAHLGIANLADLRSPGEVLSTLWIPEVVGYIWKENRNDFFFPFFPRTSHWFCVIWGYGDLMRPTNLLLRSKREVPSPLVISG